MLRSYLVAVCGIPKYGSESEFQKPNRTVPNYFSNSEKSEFRKSRTSDFFWISHFFSDDQSHAIRAHANIGLRCVARLRALFAFTHDYTLRYLGRRNIYFYCVL